MLSSHFTFVMPYQPGTTRRSGNPCWGGRGAPFSSYTSMTSSRKASGRRDSVRSAVRRPLDAAVETREEHLDGVVERARFLEERTEWRAAPFARSDGFENPRHARRARLEPCAAVAGALHRHPSSHHRPRADVAERELELVAHASADAQAPAARIDRGNVEVRQEVVEPDGRHVVAQRLERRAVVARRAGAPGGSSGSRARSRRPGTPPGH